MGRFTVFLIKSEYHHKPRYEVVGGEVVEHRDSIFAEGVTASDSASIAQHIESKDLEVRRIRNSSSNQNAYFRAASPPHSPWWQSFWNINEQINVASADCLVVERVAGRTLVITHGQSRYLINPYSIVHDFGLKSALNMIDPKKIKTTDTFTPSEVAMRERKQSGMSTAIDQYQIDIFQSLLKAVSGKCKDTYLDLFKSVQGTDSFKFPYAGHRQGLATLLGTLVSTYSSDSYQKIGFDWIDNFRPVKDLQITQILDNTLVSAVQSRDYDIVISLPFSFGDDSDVYFQFRRVSRRHQQGGMFPTIAIDQYYALIDRAGIAPTLEELKAHQLQAIDYSSRRPLVGPSMYQALHFETKIETKTYFIESGSWYEVATTFQSRIDDQLKTIWKTPQPAYPSFNQKALSSEAMKQGVNKEYLYNSELANYLATVGTAELLDTAIVHHAGAKFEICDVLHINLKGNVLLIHNKYKYGSSALSHLFGQGLVSVEYLLDQATLLEANKKISQTKLRFPSDFWQNHAKYEVVYGVISKRNRKGDFSIPMFARINLDHHVRALKRLGFNTSVIFIEVK